MTNEDAINLLDNLLGMIEDSQDNDYDTALKMAIEALKQIRCKDCKHYETFISTRTKDGRMVWDENCVKFRRSTTADGFCAWAERRTDE